jgi:hypothetical protein
MKRMKYLQWDRVADSQVLKIFSTQYATSYLSNPAGSTHSESGGDRALYARLTYNASTGAIQAQSVEIRAPRQGGALGCIKTEFGGTLTGTLDGYRPALGTAALLTNNDKMGADGSMDGITGVPDSISTLSNAGTQISAANLSSSHLPIALDYSCNDLKTANGAGQAFKGGNVNYSAIPSSIFPN